MREVKDRNDLAKLFFERGYTIGAEIGVWKGWYSSVLIRENPNLLLYCIDPWLPYAEQPSRIKNERCFRETEKRLMPHNVKIIRKTSAVALNDFPDRSLDFVYIDGAHDYENVRHDINEWSKKVRIGGIVAGHDYFYYTNPAGLEFGIVRAVDEYVKENNQQLMVTKEEFAPSYYWVNQLPNKRFSFFGSVGGKSITGVIRAEQPATFLGGRMNPTLGHENDICIYSWIEPPMDCPKNTYLDLGDRYPFQRILITRPELSVITMTRFGRDFVFTKIQRDNIVIIPQHHCNYLEEKRERRDILTAGIIGGFRSYEGVNAPLLGTRLQEIGVQLAVCIHPRSRVSVVDFYKKIDVQIVFRPVRSNSRMRMLSTPLKLENASSFGIPTVSYPEMSFVDEFDGCFLPVLTEDAVIEGVKKLKDDPVLYSELSTRGIEVAKKYHIRNIARLYEQL